MLEEVFIFGFEFEEIGLNIDLFWCEFVVLFKFIDVIVENFY